MTKNDPAVMTRMMIWGALLMAQLIYLVVGTVVPSQADPINQVEMIMMGVIGVTDISVAIFGLPLFVKPTKKTLLTFFIIQWAMIESCAVLGIVGKMMGAPMPFLYIMVGFAMTGMLFTMPTEKHISDILPADDTE